jgi:hypothetical protein
MFLDSFPLHEPEVRPVRPLREPAMETAKSRSAWPFIVAGNGFGMVSAVRDQHKSMPSVPTSAFSACGSSFVT